MSRELRRQRQQWRQPRQEEGSGGSNGGSGRLGQRPADRASEAVRVRRLPLPVCRHSWMNLASPNRERLAAQLRNYVKHVISPVTNVGEREELEPSQSPARLVVFTQATRMYEGGGAKHIIHAVCQEQTLRPCDLGPPSLGKKPGYAVHALRCTG